MIALWLAALLLHAADPVRRIANRRRIIAALRSSAVYAEETARDSRERANRLEVETDQLEADRTEEEPT